MPAAGRRRESCRGLASLSSASARRQIDLRRGIKLRTRDARQDLHVAATAGTSWKRRCAARRSSTKKSSSISIFLRRFRIDLCRFCFDCAWIRFELQIRFDFCLVSSSFFPSLKPAADVLMAGVWLLLASSRVVRGGWVGARGSVGPCHVGVYRPTAAALYLALGRWCATIAPCVAHIAAGFLR